MAKTSQLIPFYGEEAELWRLLMAQQLETKDPNVEHRIQELAPAIKDNGEEVQKAIEWLLKEDSSIDGMICPICGQTERFLIAVTTLRDISADGSDYPKMSADEEWDDDSYCQCYYCCLDGKVRDFTPKCDIASDNDSYCPDCGDTRRLHPRRPLGEHFQKLLELLLADELDDVTCGLSDIRERDREIDTLVGLSSQAERDRVNTVYLNILSQTKQMVSGAPYTKKPELLVFTIPPVQTNSERIEGYITEQPSHVAICFGCDGENVIERGETERQMAHRLAKEGWRILEDQLHCPGCFKAALCADQS